MILIAHYIDDVVCFHLCLRVTQGVQIDAKFGHIVNKLEKLKLFKESFLYILAYPYKM